MNELNRDIKISPSIFRLEQDYFSEEEATTAWNSFESMIKFFKKKEEYTYFHELQNNGTYWKLIIFIEKNERKSKND